MELEPSHYTQGLLDALCAEDFLSFVEEALGIIEPGRALVPSWHIEHLAWQLHEVALGRERRLIINVPPRSLKSLLVSVIFVAFLMGRDPTLKVIVASHTNELARTHATNFRRLVSSAFFARLFPKFQLAAAENRVMTQKTTLNGHRIATSVGATITGQGADLIIVDDPNRAKDVSSEAHRLRVNTYFDQELFTRLNDKQRGKVILVMQRLHEDDLTGHLLTRGRWTHTKIPARAAETAKYRKGPRVEDVYVRPEGDILLPTLNDEDSLEDLRATLGSLSFEAQYQQNPTPAEGAVIKRSWLRYYDSVPDNLEFVLVSWDLASTVTEESDYSVGTVWGRLGREFYLLDVVRGRMEAPDLRRCIEETHLEWDAHATIIEKAGIGDAIGSEMHRQSRIRPILIPVRLDKQARLLAESPKFEAHQVLLPREAGFLATIVGELLAFPFGRYDDQVDSTSQALRYMSNKMPRLPKLPNTRVEGRPAPIRPKGKLLRP
jgi:predicted phage terminase large subunit-like protein